MAKNLGMAYAIKKKNAKKMASGGVVNESAKTEHRPMPDERDKDSKMVDRNGGNKTSKDDSWSSDVTVRQAQKPSLTRLSQPKIVGSDAFSVRNRDQRDENNDQIDSFYPESAAQPRKRYDEYGANRQGPLTPSLKMKMMAEGGSIEEEEEEIEHAASIASAIMARDKRKMMAEGGQVDIESNGQEDSNQFHERSEAALKENLDSDLMDVSQPDDSNEHGRSLSDEDVHNMSKIERIMARMSRRSPITR